MRRTRMTTVVSLVLVGCGGAHTEEWRMLGRDGGGIVF